MHTPAALGVDARATGSRYRAPHALSADLAEHDMAIGQLHRIPERG